MLSAVTDGEGGIQRMASYYNGKALWNALRPLIPGEENHGPWDFSSVVDGENRRAIKSVAEWAGGRKSLAQIFKPSLDMCREIIGNPVHKDGPVMFFGFCNEFGGPYSTWQGFASYIISTGFPSPPWWTDRLEGCTDVTAT